MGAGLSAGTGPRHATAEMCTPPFYLASRAQAGGPSPGSGPSPLSLRLRPRDESVRDERPELRREK